MAVQKPVMMGRGMRRILPHDDTLLPDHINSLHREFGRDVILLDCLMHKSVVVYR